MQCKVMYEDTGLRDPPLSSVEVKESVEIPIPLLPLQALNACCRVKFIL